MKTRSSAKSERARKAARKERRKMTMDKQEQNTARQKEEGRLRREAGVVAEVRKKRPNKISLKGTEKVDSTILKVLGKTPKSKVTALARGKREASKVVAQEERSSRISRKIIHEKMQERKRSKLPKKNSVEKKQPVCQVLPCVDLGPDLDADGPHFGNADGAVALVWPLGPDCSEPGSGDEAWALPIQAPLEPMPPCTELFQVRQKQVTETKIPNGSYIVSSFTAILN